MKFKSEYIKLIGIFQIKFCQELKHRNYAAVEVLQILILGLLLNWETIYEVSELLGISKDQLYNKLKALNLRDWRKLFHSFFDQYAVNELKKMQNKSPSSRSRAGIQLSIDDSVIRRYGRQLSYLGKWWSGQFHSVLNGQDIVLVVLKIGESIIPVRFMLMSKLGRYTNRHDAVCRLMDSISTTWSQQGIDIARIPVSMDAGYADNKEIDKIKNMGYKKILTGVKNNYVITKKRTKHITNPLAEVITQTDIENSQTDKSWAIQEKVCVYKGNSPTFDNVTAIGRFMLGKMRYCFAIGIQRTAEILRVWQSHHWIEEVFKRMKGLLSWGKYRLRGKNGAYANIVLPFLAYYVLLQLQKTTGKTFGELCREFEKWKCSGVQKIFDELGLKVIKLNIS